MVDLMANRKTTQANNMYWTKTKLAGETGIPLSTVKYYMKNYDGYFPSEKVDGYTHPVYDDTAIEVLNLIKELMDANTPKAEVLQRLEQEFKDTYIPLTEHARQHSDNPSAALATTNSTDNLSAGQQLTTAIANSLVANEQAMMALSRMNDEHGRTIAKQEQQIGERDDRISELETENSTLKDDKSNLESRVEELEAENAELKRGGVIRRLFAEPKNDEK